MIFQNFITLNPSLIEKQLRFSKNNTEYIIPSYYENNKQQKRKVSTNLLTSSSFKSQSFWAELQHATNAAINASMSSKSLTKAWQQSKFQPPQYRPSFNLKKNNDNNPVYGINCHNKILKPNRNELPKSGTNKLNDAKLFNSNEPLKLFYRFLFLLYFLFRRVFFILSNFLYI